MGIFSFVKAGGKRFATIKSVKPAVGKSKIKKAVDDVRLTALKARGQMKKQTQDFDSAIRKVQTKIGQTSQKLKGEPVTESGVSKGKDMKKFKTGKQLAKEKKEDDAIAKEFGVRFKKAGGGMMGRRMGYSEGSNGKPISRSKNPGILAMSKTAKGRKVVKERFKFNPNRIVARKGGKA